MPKYIVRYGSMRALGVLNTRGGDRFSRGARVIARTNRGLETGEVLAEADEEAIKRLQDAASGQILREMTPEDENELQHIDSNLGKEFQTCQQFVRQLKLQMDLVDIEHVFGGERIVIYYLAEQRVDFRELVKQLASEFQTRIEMRQIGVRDEAKLLADYGDCGKPVCCNTHLSAMPPVSMKMAKLQKATLDPTKISGRCGRLKCCLRYEYDTYEELHKDLPPIGSDIVTEHGRSRVLSQEVLSQQLLIQTEDHRRMVIDANEVLSIIRRGAGKRGKRGRPAPDEEGGARPDESADSKKETGSDKKAPAKKDSGADHVDGNSGETGSGKGATSEPKSRQGKSRDSSGNAHPNRKGRRPSRGRRHDQADSKSTGTNPPSESESPASQPSASESSTNQPPTSQPPTSQPPKGKQQTENSPSGPQGEAVSSGVESGGSLTESPSSPPAQSPAAPTNAPPEDANPQSSANSTDTDESTMGETSSSESGSAEGQSGQGGQGNPGKSKGGRRPRRKNRSRKPKRPDK